MICCVISRQTRFILPLWWMSSVVRPDIVTMEDIIEEIVGEIHDEYDDEERTYAVLNDHTWVFEAKTQLTDFL